jgi:acyl transferase domain-containing protein
MMDPAVAPTVEAMTGVAMSAPQIPILSTVTGEWLLVSEATDPDYWGRNLRQTVRFSDAIEALGSDADRIFLEVGPGQTLTTLTKQILGSTGTTRAHPSLSHPRQDGAELHTLVETAGRLWLAGLELDWDAFSGESRGRVPLPTYPFERKRHWIEPTMSEAPPQSASIAGGSPKPANNAYGSDQVPSTATSAAADPGAPASAVELLVQKQLEIMAQQVAAVRRGR